MFGSRGLNSSGNDTVFGHLILVVLVLKTSYFPVEIK